MKQIDWKNVKPGMRLLMQTDFIPVPTFVDIKVIHGKSAYCTIPRAMDSPFMYHHDGINPIYQIDHDDNIVAQ